MVTAANILIVDSDEISATRLRVLVEQGGGRATACSTLAGAQQALASRRHALVVVVPRADVDPAAVVRAADEFGAATVLAAAGPVSASHCDAAFELGCVGVLAATTDPADAVRTLDAAARRGAAASAAREEQRRLAFQCEELQRRCDQQTERVHDVQESFFLDLSRMMTIITNIMDGIVFVDRDGNVTLMNSVAEDLLGTKSFVAIGKPLAALHGSAELLDELAADHARLEGKEIARTIEVHHNEQDLLYIKCVTSHVLDYRGQPAGVLTVLKDVTAEFKTDQLKNQYLSIVAHELRTPLTGIKTFATMMAKGSLGELSERQQRVCESIREQSVRLEHQIDKLINLGNLESADYGQDREVFGVGEFATGMLAPFEQPARDRHIDLSMTVEGEDRCLFADRADLRRACQALIENAVKFTRDGGTVQVRITAGGDGSVRFGVRDDGIGIDPRYHRRIFEKFFQVEDPLTRHHGGAGLGLFVAKGIIEAHGSRIEVSSQLGQGADFSFAMPVHRPASTTTAAAGAAL